MKSKVWLTLLLAFMFCLPVFAKPFVPEYVQSAQVDLNGDGIKDNVSIKDLDPESDWSGRFELTVNNLVLESKLDFKVDGIVIVDIDQSDVYLEVAVYTSGPSSDDEYLIYRYDGKKLLKVGLVYRWAYFPGNGIVYANDWMQFWEKRDKYVLNKQTGVLDLVPQELYYVGEKATVVKTFPLYRSRQTSDIVAWLREGSEIEILVCDVSPGSKEAEYIDDLYQDWYLIKSSSDLIGWARLDSFLNKVEGLPLAD
ncbi:hypothetical protein ACFL5U_03055 [Candidatus Margulisiibacteriota bacterium]